jgi:hypothetical protein
VLFWPDHALSLAVGGCGGNWIVPVFPALMTMPTPGQEHRGTATVHGSVVPAL